MASTPVKFCRTAPAPSLGNPGGQPVPVTPVDGDRHHRLEPPRHRPGAHRRIRSPRISRSARRSAQSPSNDPDGANDTYTFTLVAGAGGDDNAIFTLTGTTLTANAPFNYEVKKDYTVRIQVSDGKGSSFAQAVTIEVVDVNETPTVLALDNNSVIEDLGSAGQVVANVTVTDPDNFDSYNTPDTFTMALAGADAAYFEVSDLQIKVRAAGLETAESKPSYTFDVVDHRQRRQPCILPATTTRRQSPLWWSITRNSASAPSPSAARRCGRRSAERCRRRSRFWPRQCGAGKQLHRCIRRRLPEL
jgi:hypothetical protein